MHERTRVDRRREEEEAARNDRQPTPTPTPPVRRQPLIVGPSDDPHERDADRLADLVVGRFDVPPVLRGEAEHRVRRGATTTRITRRAVIGAEGGELDADTARSLAAARGGGAPIEPHVQEHLGQAMGADVRNVRLHAGPRAADLNERMQASAFTIGHDVFFRDGIPDTSKPGGMHLLAHEVAHTVQQGASPVNRRIVRRKLIPKALNAFNAAAAANPSFATGRKDTDDLAAESDQEDLSRVHGRMHTGQDSADSQKVAHFVRAVVLTEYSSRLRTLETAVGKDGNPLGDKQKAAKKSVYKTKADEFRKKHVPLVGKGSQSPETKGFLKQYGFESAFAPTGATTAPTPLAEARLDVRSTFIGGPILGVRVRAHLFIVYTAKDGRQMYFRGGPDDNMFTVADMGDYVPGTIDWDPSAPSVTILEGAAAEAKLDALIEATSVIDGMKVPYRATVGKEFGGDNPNKAEELLTMAAMGVATEGENCNATAWTILTRAGISKKKKPSGRHPGWGSVLGSKTAGKENALPPTEAPKMGKSYVVDESREMADDAGEIQVYRDRALFDPLTKVTTGTKVMLYDETNSWRQVGINGKIGYVPRRTDDALYDLYPRWIDALRDEFDDANIQLIIDNRDDPAILKQASRATGIPRAYVARVADMALKGTDDVIAGLLWSRVEMLGKARVRDLLDKPDEIARLAANLGADPDDVADVAAEIVGAVEQELKVPAVLLKHLNDPNAANMAMNQAPDYPALDAVATEMGEDFGWVVKIVEALRPKKNQGEFLEALLKADPISLGEMPNVADYMVNAWAVKTGASADYLKQRLVEIHKANEAEKARLKAEADAKAKAEAAARRKAKKKKAAKKKKQAAKKAKALEQAKEPEKAKESRPVKVAPGIPENQAQQVYLTLSGLGLDDQGIWELVNDLPDLAELKDVAKMHSVGVQDVIDVALYYFDQHKGSTQLITMLNKMSEATARKFADGTGYEADYKKLVDMVGMDRDVIVEKIAAWVAKKYG